MLTKRAESQSYWGHIMSDWIPGSHINGVYESDGLAALFTYSGIVAG